MTPTPFGELFPNAYVRDYYVCTPRKIPKIKILTKIRLKIKAAMKHFLIAAVHEGERRRLMDEKIVDAVVHPVHLGKLRGIRVRKNEEVRFSVDRDVVAKGRFTEAMVKRRLNMMFYAAGETRIRTVEPDCWEDWDDGLFHKQPVFPQIP